MEKKKKNRAKLSLRRERRPKTQLFNVLRTPGTGPLPGRSKTRVGNPAAAFPRVSGGPSGLR